MPRANRYFLPGLVWHLTHRGHERDCLLTCVRDRTSDRTWLYEARTRVGLCVLNYMITSNHIHLLVKDHADGVIARRMPLIAGRTAQAYNRRTSRLGAFWEDRDHATAIESAVHLTRCLVYIDLNMVRTGVVKHPAMWPHSGYLAIQQPPERYRVIDLAVLSRLCGFGEIAQFQKAHCEWVEAGMRGDTAARDDRWSESIAVGSERCVEHLNAELGVRAQHRQVALADGLSTLRESAEPYRSHFDRTNEVLRPNNTVTWQTIVERIEG